MPRPARRAAPAAQNGEAATATPTRNPITATIPPFMLDTPDRAPFIDTQQPTHNPTESIVPPTDVNTNTAGPRLNRNEALPNQDVHAHGDNPGPDGSQASTHALTAPSEVGEQSYLSSVQQEAEDARALVGLREIGGLATWTLSSAKPGCGLAQLRSPDLRLFWQSDGPQPHVLSLHYPKVVSVSKLRMYLDYELDESYTPVETKFCAGMSEGALVEFGHWACVEETDPETGETRSSVENVKGWIDIDLTGVGGRDRRFFQAAEDDDAEDGREAGDVLKAMVIQMRVCSNHQNGKDCHVRGFQVFARDETVAREGAKIPVRRKKNKGTANGSISDQREAVGVQMADWMGDPEIR